MTDVYSVATGNVDVLNKRSRRAAKYIMKQEGLTAVTPYFPDGTLWFFDSLNNAKIARNRMEAKGIKCGRNIMHAQLDEDTQEIVIIGKAD